MNKRKFILIFILILCLSGLIAVLFIPKGKATSDLDYTFDNDYIFNSDNLTYDSFNIRNQTTIFQDNYTATYDFLDDSIGSNPTNFIVVENSGFIDVITTLSSHNNIVEIFDDDGGSLNSLTSDHVISESYGTFEFWLYTSDSTKLNEYFIMDGATTNSIYLMINDGNFKYYDGSTHIITSCLSNTWYHNRIDFELTDGAYKGLAINTFYSYINGVKFGAYSVRNNPTTMDIVRFYSATADNDYSFYIDAIGYSWNIDYDIGQNIAYPEITNIEIQEIDKCEFAYNLTTFEPNTLDSNIIDNNWIENDDASDIHVKTSGLYDQIDIDYGNTQDQDDYGIYKEFGYNLENIFNITFDITSIALYNPHLDGWYFNIYTYDDTLLVSLLFTGTDLPDISLYYYDGSDYIFIYELLDVIGSFDFNIYINNRVILSLNHKDVIYNWYFSELTSNIGINTIEVIGGHKDDIGDFANLVIDSIGLYVNGSSYLPHDLLSIIIDTDIENWEDSIHDIFEITGNGNFSFSVFYTGIFEDVIISFSEYNNEQKRAHYINGNIFKGSSPYTFVCISNISFTVSEISVYAVILTEGINNYSMYFTYENVDTEINFFYVSNNRLYFTHTANQNDTLEYIQASFNIDDIYTVNRSISFKTYFYGISQASFKTNYISLTYSIFILKLGYDTINLILPQQQIIKTFTILITDNDNNDYYGNSNGYITSITLRYYPDITLTLTTLNLIGIMIPIILIFIPTIAVSSVYGKKIIIPMLIFMTIICFATDLIPLWLFTIMMICYISTLIFQYKYKENEMI